MFLLIFIMLVLAKIDVKAKDSKMNPPVPFYNAQGQIVYSQFNQFPQNRQYPQNRDSYPSRYTYPYENNQFQSGNIGRERLSNQNYQSSQLGRVSNQPFECSSLPFQIACGNPGLGSKTGTQFNDLNFSTAISSSDKKFNGTYPSNFQKYPYASVHNFDIDQLEQTDVSSVRDKSLKKAIDPHIQKMGIIQDRWNDVALGTCTLIGDKYVLVPRHVIEGCDIGILNVEFRFGRLQSLFANIVEEDENLDYAILELEHPLGKALGSVPISFDNPTGTGLALLHYPRGGNLMVSVNSFDQTTHQANYLVSNHDSDHVSSGGAYINSEGQMVAMHLGSEKQFDKTNVFRHARSLEIIERSNPNSLLIKLASNPSYQPPEMKELTLLDRPDDLEYTFHVDLEGRESEKILRGLLGNRLKTDKKIQKNKSGTIAFNSGNLEYIKDKYKTQYATFINECTGLQGLHGSTRLYSVLNGIESDHTLPYAVWKDSGLIKAKKVGNKRLGENQMPTITLPYAVHRNLRTTGGVLGWKAFHAKLLTLCKAGEVDKALVKCFKEYNKNGFDLKKNKVVIKASLDKHVELKLIKPSQKTFILNQLGL